MRRKVAANATRQKLARLQKRVIHACILNKSRTDSKPLALERTKA
jgi:hypothetical protein